MNGPNFHFSDDYIALMARERQSALLDDAARRRIVRAQRTTSRTRPRFLRWH